MGDRCSEDIPSVQNSPSLPRTQAPPPKAKQSFEELRSQAGAWDREDRYVLLSFLVPKLCLGMRFYEALLRGWPSTSLACRERSTVLSFSLGPREKPRS